MKRLILLCVVVFTTLSCEKESDDPDKEYCWKCTLTVTTTVTGSAPVVGTAETEHCGLTQAEIDEQEKRSNGITSSTSGGITTTYRTSGNCVKK